MKKLSSILFVFCGFSFLTTSCGESQDTLSQLREQIRTNHFQYMVVENPATQYTIEQLCGLKPYAGWEKDGKFVHTEKSQGLSLPAAYDARDHQMVSSIRNQGACGSCWAFSTLAVLESVIMADQPTPEPDLSEQYLVSCNKEGWGCNGGWFAHDFLVDRGAILETCYPYTASDSACRCECEKSFKVTNWFYVAGTSSVPSVDAIKNAIYTYGPVAAAVYVDQSFQYYGGGIYQGPSGQVNHGIQLVGWDDNNGDGYWILKNSWGPGWGESGFMRIKYGSNDVGYAANFIDTYQSGTWPPDTDCNSQCNSALSPPASAKGVLTQFVKMKNDPMLNQVANAIRNNAAKIAEILKDNRVMANLIQRSIWTNLDALQDFIEHRNPSRSLDLGDLHLAIQFADAAVSSNHDKYSDLKKLLPKVRELVARLDGKRVKAF